jgi:hypothetical protein
MDPRIRDGIIASARSLGMNPADLATIISYETGGTFSPTQAGPTTQWGQHRGLIQFGEPQARQYGVNWQDPVGSQLGPDGAVVRYLRQNGYKPGMGLLDAYSIVNAGAPGRYNASDANNGGAPGTVADKVNNQMAPHQAKAAALLGGENLSFGPSVPPVNMGLAGMFGAAGGLGTPAIMPSFGAAAPDPGAEIRRRGEEREAEAQRRKQALFGEGIAGMFG